jgi:hypothetical protein
MSRKTTTNATKNNRTINIDELFTELSTATCKKSLVDTMTKFGLQCVTSPTTTPNTNDLYLQFNANKCGDVSRVQLTSKSIKLWCTKYVASLFIDDYAKMSEKQRNDELSKLFDNVNDGSSRKYRQTIARTIENFTTVFNTLFDNGVIVPLKTE